MVERERRVSEGVEAKRGVTLRRLLRRLSFLFLFLFFRGTRAVLFCFFLIF